MYSIDSNSNSAIEQLSFCEIDIISGGSVDPATKAVIIGTAAIIIGGPIVGGLIAAGIAVGYISNSH